MNQFEPFSENEDAWTETDNFFIKDELTKITSTTLSYGITYRHPFTKSFIGNIGAKYIFNYPLEPSSQVFSQNTPRPIDFADVFFDFQRENFLTISLKVGITYIL